MFSCLVTLDNFSSASMIVLIQTPSHQSLTSLVLMSFHPLLSCQILIAVSQCTSKGAFQYKLLKINIITDPILNGPCDNNVL